MTDLDEFRENWKVELGLKENEKLNQAVDAWLEAQERERTGEMGKAIMLYKKAEILDPSVYHHMRNVPVEYQKAKQKEFRHLEEDKDYLADSDDDENQNHLVDSLNTLAIDELLHTDDPISKGYRSDKKHLSDLPREILTKIASSVVGPNLSYKSLSQLGMTCKCFYSISFSDKIWRDGCEKLWDTKTLASLHKQHSSYRKVFIKTPRPDISEGLYVALESYWREGELSANKSGWGAAQQHVIYRKYIRFLPNRQLFIHCSADNPKSILRKLMGPDFMLLKGSMIGTWKFNEDNQNEINAVLERLPKDSMHLEFFLATWLMERRGKRLKWTDYKYESINMKANSNNSVAYDVREYQPLVLHKIPKNFQFKDK